MYIKCTKFSLHTVIQSKMHFNLQDIINVTTVSQRPVKTNYKQNQIRILSLYLLETLECFYNYPINHVKAVQWTRASGNAHIIHE